MSFDPQVITDAIVSHALASGHFEAVNGHEPKSAPTAAGLTAAVWCDAGRPIPEISGLNRTSGIIIWNVRLYCSFLSQPEDSIDPRLTNAVHALLTAYSGDFELGGNVRNVDLLGAYSDGLSWRAGYLNQDSRVYRVCTITFPVVINDLWSQSP